jgi:hypothetical protein
MPEAMDKAVEAALEAYERHGRGPVSYANFYMEAALEAATPFLLAEVEAEHKEVTASLQAESNENFERAEQAEKQLRELREALRTEAKRLEEKQEDLRRGAVEVARHLTSRLKPYEETLAYRRAAQYVRWSGRFATSQLWAQFAKQLNEGGFALHRVARSASTYGIHENDQEDTANAGITSAASVGAGAPSLTSGGAALPAQESNDTGDSTGCLRSAGESQTAGAVSSAEVSATIDFTEDERKALRNDDD